MGMVVLSAGIACGQDRAEVFGGYSFARHEGANMGKGFDASGTGYVNKWFGIEGDFSGHYWGQSVLVTNGFVVIPVQANVRLLSFQGGPKFAFRAERVTPYVHALFGLAQTMVSGSVGALSLSTSTTGFSAAIGGGLDIPVGQHLAIRAAQVDYSYVQARDFDIHSNGVRIVSGLVVRF